MLMVFLRVVNMQILIWGVEDKRPIVLSLKVLLRVWHKEITMPWKLNCTENSIWCQHLKHNLTVGVIGLSVSSSMVCSRGWMKPKTTPRLVSFRGLQGRIQDFFRRGCIRLLLYFNTNKPHRFFFFCRIWVVLENRRSSWGGGVHTPCTLPLDPPLVYSQARSSVSHKMPLMDLLCIRQLNPLVDVDFRFISALLHWICTQGS